MNESCRLNERELSEFSRFFELRNTKHAVAKGKTATARNKPCLTPIGQLLRLTSRLWGENIWERRKLIINAAGLAESPQYWLCSAGVR
jgi:hypothetical protein